MKKEDLEKALRLALPGTEKMGGEGMDQVLFDGEWLRSYNENLSVSYPLKTDMEIGVKAEEFYKILMKMSGEDVDLKIIDPVGKESKLIVSNQSTKLTLKGQPVEQYQNLKAKIMSLNVSNWSPAPEGIATGLRLSMMSGLKDSRLGKISGVAFMGKNIVSTDNFKVGYFQMESGITDELFRLRISSVERLIKLGKEDFESSSINDLWLSLKSKDGMVANVRILVATDYPIDEILGVFSKYTDDPKTYELPKGLEEALDRCEILAYSEDEDFKTLISFKTEGGYLILSSRKDFGEIEDKIPWDVELPYEFYVTPGWMRTILKITRKFTISSKKLIFSCEKPNFKYLMLTKSGKEQGEL